jgi:peroxiredoxin
VTERPGFVHRKEKHGLIGPFSGRQLAILALAVIVTAFVIFVATLPLGSVEPLGPNNPGATQFVLDPNASPGFHPGDLAPELEVKRSDGTTYQLTDLDGKPVRLADLRGKAVWINFWASWCPPCQSETPVIRDVAQRYKDQGLVVIGISVQETNAADVRSYAERYQLGYTIAADLTGEIFRLYRPPGLPTQIFIGTDGAIRSVVLAPLSEAGAEAQVQAILPR